MESTSSIENTSAQPTHKLQLPKLSESISNLLNRVPLAQKFDLLFLISTLQKGRKLLYRFPTDFYKGSLNGDEPDIVLPRSEIGDQVDFYIEKFLESLNTCNLSRANSSAHTNISWHDWPSVCELHRHDNRGFVPTEEEYPSK